MYLYSTSQWVFVLRHLAPIAFGVEHSWVEHGLYVYVLGEWSGMSLALLLSSSV